MGRVVVVGAGIVGSLHALIAHDRGHDVVHIEREATTRGASVRNFGLLWVSGRQAGPELALALRARAGWDRVAARIPAVGLRPDGSLTLARDDLELKLLVEAGNLADADARGFRLLDPAEARELNPAIATDVCGALWCQRDGIVEPRLAARAIVDYLRAQSRYQWLPRREIVDVADHRVVDHDGSVHEADIAVICTGAWHTGVAARGLHGIPVRRVRLQMLQTFPFPVRLTTSIADIDALRYYPAYAELPVALLPPQPAVAQRAHAQLLIVQRQDGSLTIGDTHEYDEPFGFDVQEAVYTHLLERAGQLLGRPLPPVRSRWAGVYSQVTDDRLYIRQQLADGVVLVTGLGGRGMTCAPTVAAETFGWT